MENLDQTYKRLLSENKKEEKCKGCGEPIGKCSCNTVEEAAETKKKPSWLISAEKRAEKKEGKVVKEGSSDVPFDMPYTTVKKTITDKSGAKHGPMSRARDLARSALNKHLNATYNEYNPEKDKLKKQHFGMAEEVELEEGTFKYHMDKAVAAHMKGDSKKALYHLDNAKTARYAMPTKDYAKNKDLLDKYKKMTEEVELTEGAADKLGDKIDNAESSEHAKSIISKAPTKHLQYLHHWNMGLSGGRTHKDMPHIKAELTKRKSLLSSAESSKHFDEEVELEEDQLDELKHSTVSNYMRKARTQLSNIEVSRRGSGDENFGAEKARRRANTLNKIADKTDSRAVRDQLKKSTAFVKEEQIDEISKGTIGSYIKKATTDSTINRKIATDFEHRAKRSKKQDMKDANTSIANQFKDKSWKRQDNINKAVDRLTKEEVEHIDEANHRDFASQGKMHPDMAKHMEVGSHMDYYEPKTGDKVHGKVMHKSDTEIHMKQTHDSYDDKKVGSVHKFKVTNKLDEQIDEVLKPTMGAGAYIDDFVHSKNPKFAGKSKEMRRQMALAAYYAAKKGVKEEVELDESTEMARLDLQTIINHVERLKPMVEKEMDLPDWIESKITMAADYIGCVADYVEAAEQIGTGLEESEQKVNPTVKTDKYSWGTMKTIHHGSSFSIPLHPEHHHHIATMQDQQQHTIKTEDGRQYHVKREGDTVHFHGVNGGNKTSVPHKSLAEEKQVDEAWVLRQKKKEKKPVKEEIVKSFKDFITEMEFDKSGKYVHKGKYGTSYDDPEGKEDGEKPAAEKAEKRGRGRPAGAKSGARQIGGASKKGSGVEYTGYKLHLPNSNK